MLADFPVDAPRYFLKFPVRQALPTSTAIKAGGVYEKRGGISGEQYPPFW